ncbi:unnamed protein product [Calicophoron daubneyi]|uniref:Uncharacterized protein n=1 Tax=Calicophoron daubneyi TaxID=300641 RepID=A0AAV2TW29_CALDB
MGMRLYHLVSYLPTLWLILPAIFGLDLCLCQNTFYDVPIVPDTKYLDNNTDFFNESNGYLYDPYKALVKCSLLPLHSIWCEPPVELSTTAANGSFGCKKFGGRLFDEVLLTSVACHALNNIECFGNRTFMLPNYPCLHYKGHYFVTTLMYSILLGFFGVDRLCLGYVGPGYPGFGTDMSHLDYHVMDSDTQFMEKYPNGVPLSDLIPFYEAIERNEPLKLEWVCPGRINPRAETATPKTPQKVQSDTSAKGTDNQPSPSKLAEFDFDASSSQVDMAFFPSVAGVGAGQVGINPPLRHINAGRHPPRQPRVANMDKILNDFFRTRKEANPTHSTAGYHTSVLNHSSPTTTIHAPAGEHIGTGTQSSTSTAPTTTDSVTKAGDPTIVVSPNFSEASLTADPPPAPAPGQSGDRCIQQSEESLNFGWENNREVAQIHPEPDVACANVAATNTSLSSTSAEANQIVSDKEDVIVSAASEYHAPELTSQMARAEINDSMN